MAPWRKAAGMPRNTIQIRLNRIMHLGPFGGLLEHKAHEDLEHAQRWRPGPSWRRRHHGKPGATKRSNSQKHGLFHVSERLPALSRKALHKNPRWRFAAGADSYQK
jgi:hypothetical protein